MSAAPREGLELEEILAPTPRGWEGGFVNGAPGASVVVIISLVQFAVPFPEYPQELMISKRGSSKGARKAQPMVATPELSETARTLASLALDKIRQNGVLRVRQREQLRRAFAKATGPLGWDTIPGSSDDRLAAATKDLAELAEVGARLLESDLSDQVTWKKGEIREIERVAESIRALADDPSAAYPTQVEYSHTMRNAAGHLVTTTTTLTMNDATEALNAATTLEKRLEALTKLRDQMLVELKDRQRQLSTMRQGLGGFVASSHGLLAELLAVPT